MKRKKARRDWSAEEFFGSSGFSFFGQQAFFTTTKLSKTKND
jgi:hypothetical protein